MPPACLRPARASSSRPASAVPAPHRTGPARPRLVRPVALLLAVLAALATPAAGHASPEPLDVEVHVLADDTDDLYAVYGGYDVQDVFVREAAFAAHGGHGLVVRAYLYGGKGPAGAVEALDLEVEADAGAGPQAFRVSTSDGTSWSGDVPVVEAMFEAGAEPGVQQGYVQVFLTLARLGAAVGGSVGGFAVRTYADGDLRDVAPGGRPVPGTGGAVVEPRESTVVTESVTLAGPGGYTTTQARLHEGRLELAVQNRITTTGQHVLVRAEAAPGWTVSGPDPAAATVGPGVHPTFTMEAAPEQDAPPLVLWVETDLGGQERVEVPAQDAPATSTPGQDGGDGTARPKKDSPGPGLLVGAGALGVAAAGARRLRGDRPTRRTRRTRAPGRTRGTRRTGRRPPPHALALVLLVLAPAALAGCARGTSDPAVERLADTVLLPPGGYLEANLLVEAGAVLAFTWNATGTLSFDVHTHDASGVQTLRQATGASSAGDVTASADGALSFLWENRGPAAAELRYEVAGPFRIDSVHGPV